MKANNSEEMHRASIAIAEKHDLSPEEALKVLESQGLSLIVGDEIRTSVPLQVALASMVNAAHRIFLGGVRCFLEQPIPNLLSLPGETLNEVVENLGGILCEDGKPDENDPKFAFGKACEDKATIEIVCSGWQAGINFYDHKRMTLAPSDTSVSIGGICAASIGLFYMFNRVFLRLDNIFECPTGISLWNLDSHRWYEPNNEGPKKINTPKKIWLVGLGHLGQAYLWTLGLSRTPGHEYLYALQDEDLVKKENLGAQVLSFPDDIDRRKARVCSEFLEESGIMTQIIEKPFLNDDQNKEWSNQYRILLTGVDNIQARRSIDKTAFDLCLDGGTNGKLELFDSFTFKNLSVHDTPIDEIWPKSNKIETILHPKLYEKGEKGEGCGQLFNKAISTPFMGLFGAAILVSEIIRSLNSGKRYAGVSVQLRNLEGRKVVEQGDYGMEHLSLASFEVKQHQFAKN